MIFQQVRRCIRWIFVLLAGLLPGAAMAQGVLGPVPRKVSPEIQLHQREKQPRVGISAAAHAADLRARGLNPQNLNAEDCALYVTAPLTVREIALLRAQGIRIHETYVPPVPGKHPNGFYLATVNYFALSAIENDSRFARLETTEILHEPMNDLAAIQTNADDVRAGLGVTARTGAGVKIAIADSGIDLTHADFPTPVEAYDMTDGTGVGTWGTNVANTATDHGTHVAGSALGRGTLSSGKYAGAAPGASLYFYKIGNDTNGSASTTDMVEAITRARTVGCDIFSMSYGGVDAYMDGSDSMSQAIDVAVAAGVCVFISAGNEQNDDVHYSATVPPSTTTSSFSYALDTSIANGSTVLFRVMWRDGVSNDGNVVLNCTNLGGGETLTTTLFASSSRGTDARLYTLTTQSGGAGKTYNFTLQNTAASGTTPRAHLFEISGKGAFTIPDPAYTIGSPAVADGAITVGAWTQRKSWTNYQGFVFQFGSLFVDTLAPFSSLGPRIDETLKPTLVSPGAATISARDSVGSLAASSSMIIDNDGLNLNGSGPANYYVKQGTSMACPFAAGVAALLLEANPSWTPAQVLQALTETASEAETPNSSVGYGLIDALAAVQVDLTAPEVLSIETSNAGPTNADAIEYTVTFSESVTGVVAARFSVTTVSGNATGSVDATVNGSGDTYTVTVENIAGDGTLRLDLTSTTGIVDGAGNALNATATGESSTIDNTAPTAEIGTPSADSILTGETVDFPVTYSGAASVNLVEGNVTLHTTGDANGTVTVLDGTSATPTVRVSDVSGEGTVAISIAAGAGQDAAGNSDSGDGPSQEVTVELSDIYVDFSAAAGGNGTAGNPYNTLAAAVAAAPDDWIIRITAGNSSESIRITKKLKLLAPDGAVRIGD